MRLPEPKPAVRQALKLLPHRPGVYLMRDETGRVIYVGRSGDLANRARSYWVDLRDRPHLARMVARVAWLEPVVCASEHEAAFLESDLLDRHRSRYNRTLGMESCVWLRLDSRPESADLWVEHEAAPRDGARWFGPYLGWEPVRQAAAGLLRLHPVRYAGTSISRTEREMARSLGVEPGDAAALASRIERVLCREPAAVATALRSLEQARDRAASRMMFEFAAEIQEEIRGLRWITQPQKLGGLDAVDADHAGVAGNVRVVLSLRGGRLAQREVSVLRDVPSQPAHRSGEREWAELARENADLMARLVGAGAVGPLGWRTPGRSQTRRREAVIATVAV
ncbi:MAG TPA: GIY-YIG nuclease family protein [Candidatus Dormibacteraeota bacterium]|nr:GIY-YIG nuclease family protein [Candidatus Dormibacteraeota bacterium]